jgi:hypothetical protein
MPNDLEILEFNLIIINDQTLVKLNADIAIVISEKRDYCLRIDSTKYFAGNLINSDNTDVNCLFETKYTNSQGKERNLCHSLKKQITIRFFQPLYASIKNIIHLK